MSNIYVLVRAVKGHGYEFRSETGKLTIYPMINIIGSCKQHKGKKFKLVQNTMYYISGQ
jgi:hypothetical protein